MDSLDSVATFSSCHGFAVQQFSLSTVFTALFLGWSCNVFVLVLNVFVSNLNVVVTLLHQGMKMIQ